MDCRVYNDRCCHLSRGYCYPKATTSNKRACPTAIFASPLTISSTFNSLFKVLFAFPSRYLFAISLVVIFSFRWNLPPFSALIPKYATHFAATVIEDLTLMDGAVTLLGTPFQKIFSDIPNGYQHEPHFQSKSGLGFELLPLHSPLLRESWLVSFPPLTYMLKFSGLSDILQVWKSGNGVGAYLCKTEPQIRKTNPLIHLTTLTKFSVLTEAPPCGGSRTCALKRYRKKLIKSHSHY